MAWIAQGNEIFFHVASQKASWLPMMNLKIFRPSAYLASPAVAFKHLLTKSPVRTRVQSNPRSFRER